MSLEAPEEKRGGWGEGRVVGDVQRKAKTDHEGHTRRPVSADGAWRPTVVVNGSQTWSVWLLCSGQSWEQETGQEAAEAQSSS